MKVVDCLKKMNKAYPANLNRMLELKQYYISMYRYFMVRLFDGNFIDDPTILNEKQIYANIVELGIKGMVNSSGSIELTSECVEYAYYKNKDDLARTFLGNLYYALKYRESSVNLDLFHETFTKSVSLNMRLVGAKVVSRSGLKLDKSTLCTMVSSGYTLECVEIKEDLWNIAMKELGIPEEEWCSDGLFDKDLSHEEEVSCINILLNGRTLLNGKYADILSKWLLEHKWSSENAMTLSKVGLVDYIYSNSSDSVLSALSRVINSYNEEDVMAIVGDTVYIKKPIKDFTIPVSMFSVSSGYPEELYCAGSLIYGYSGEGYPVEYLQEEDIRFMGLPVVSCTDEDVLVYLYDREQVGVEYNTWFKENGVNLEYDLPNWVNPFSKDPESLQYQLFEICRNGQNGVLGKIDASKFTYKEIEAAKKKVAKALVKIIGEER